METKVIPAAQPGAIDEARRVIENGGVIAFPTDTVYGLGTAVNNAAGIDSLFEIKERDPNKAIAVLVSSVEQLSQVTAEMSSMARKLAEAFWPGAITLVVSRHPALPSNISPRPTIGVRMPDHPVALALISSTGALAVTSANLSGEKSASTAQEVFEQLQGRIPLILDGGKTPGGEPSTVVDCTGGEPVILRSGPISMQDLQRILEN